MNLLKLQQDLMAELVTRERPPMYFAASDKVTRLINSAGSACYTVPNDAVFLDMRHFRKVGHLPFNEFNPKKWGELTDTGDTLGVGKMSEKIFKHGERTVYLDKNLLKYFGKNARYFQEKDLSVVAVTEEDVVVAYIMPCRPPKKAANAQK